MTTTDHDNDLAFAEIDTRELRTLLGAAYWLTGHGGKKPPCCGLSRFASDGRRLTLQASDGLTTLWALFRTATQLTPGVRVVRTRDLVGILRTKAERLRLTDAGDKLQLSDGLDITECWLKHEDFAPAKQEPCAEGPQAAVPSDFFKQIGSAVASVVGSGLVLPPQGAVLRTGHGFARIVATDGYRLGEWTTSKDWIGGDWDAPLTSAAARCLAALAAGHKETFLVGPSTTGAALVRGVDWTLAIEPEPGRRPFPNYEPLFAHHFTRRLEVPRLELSTALISVCGPLGKLGARAQVTLFAIDDVLEVHGINEEDQQSEIHIPVGSDGPRARCHISLAPRFLIEALAATSSRRVSLWMDADGSHFALDAADGSGFRALISPLAPEKVRTSVPVPAAEGVA